MQFQRPAQALAFAGAILASTAVSSAQSKSSVNAEIAAMKAEIETLKAAAANSPAFAQALQEMSSKLVVLEQELAKSRRLNESVPQLIQENDRLSETVRAMERDIEYLRTNIADIEQPTVTTGGGAEHMPGMGMQFASTDGKYTLAVGGQLHTRYQMQLPRDASTIDSAGFQVRRGRIGLRGNAGQRLSYEMTAEFANDGPALLDYYMDMYYRPELTIRLGQTKVANSKSYLSMGFANIYHELNATQERQRFDREIGVWALGSVWNDRIRYNAGVSNGSGPNSLNDNIDLVTSARVGGAVVGEYIAPGFGDVHHTPEPALTVGLAVAHDLVRLPDEIGGVSIGNTDVDGNGIDDNIRVLSSAIDAQFRFQGLEVFLEGTWRHERWGTITEHSDNGDLATLINPSNSGRRNYLGFTGEVSYFVIPHRLLVGTRVSHGRLPLLGLSGLDLPAVPADRAVQIDGIVQLYRDGYRRIGLSYGLLNYNAKNGPEPANDITHRMVIEAQLLL